MSRCICVYYIAWNIGPLIIMLKKGKENLGLISALHLELRKIDASSLYASRCSCLHSP